MRRGSIWPELLLVIAGGAVGTAMRVGVNGAFPPETSFPWATFTVNVTGALLLGALIGVFPLHPEGSTTARRLRLALGTGCLGGYTTYSTFVLESLMLAGDRGLGVALVYDLATVVVGFLAALVAMSMVVWARRRMRVEEVDADD
ncbi:MAG: CrcB family protein [Actinomycetales bacterium]|nr:CrcB family protein [Actinomycetales bacterium]